MKVDLRIDPACGQTRVTVCAPARTPQVEELLRLLEEAGSLPAFALFRGEEVRMTPRSEIFRFFAEGKGVSCQAEGGVFSVRLRLYELEAELAGTRFVRVSNSEIVNLDRVTALDLSLTGTIRLTLGGQTAVYVSRRYVKKIKAALGL